MLLSFGLKGLTTEGALQFYLRHGPFVPWPFCWDCQRRCQTGWYFSDACVYLFWVNQTASHFRKAIQQLPIASHSSKCRLTRQKVKQLDGPIRNLWVFLHLNACLAKPCYKNIKDLQLAMKGEKSEHMLRSSQLLAPATQAQDAVNCFPITQHGMLQGWECRFRGM